jgi:hypothetical protein
MKSLLKMGLVKITGKRHYRGGHAHNVYQVNLTGLEKLATSQVDRHIGVNSEDDQSQADGGVGHVDPQSGSLRPTNSSVNSQLNSKENSSINSSNDSVDGAPSENGQKQKSQDQNQPRYPDLKHQCSSQCKIPCGARRSAIAEAIEGLSEEEELEFWSELLVKKVIVGTGRSNLNNVFGKMLDKAKLLVTEHHIDWPAEIAKAALDGLLDSPDFKWSRVIRDAANPMAMICSKFDQLEKLFLERIWRSPA